MSFTDSYLYDGVNRLISVTDTMTGSGAQNYSRGFGYDAYGNMWVSTSSGITPQGNTPSSINSFTANTNQLSGTSYDQAGNQTQVNGNTQAYDAENRQVSVTFAGASEFYVYDGDGKRVEKAGASGATVFVYDAMGRMAAEYSTAANGSPCSTCYLSADHLGTTRLVVDGSGNVVGRHDYLPFGEEIAANTAGRNGQWGAGNDVVNQKFTGKERDQESQLDYFGARYYGSALGRFASADWSATPAPVPYADFSNPQSLNQYAYVLNNPLGKADSDGHCPFCLALAGGGALAEESPLLFAGPPGWTVLAGTAIVVGGVALYQHLHTSQSSANSNNDAATPPPPTKDVYIDPSKYPAAAGHAADAQAAGQPDVLTVKRPGASGRRTQATDGHPTQAGTDRDEYPPAVTAEGGKDASVRNIPSSDNRGAGAAVGNQIRDVPDGGTIKIIPKPPPPKPPTGN